MKRSGMHDSPSLSQSGCPLSNWPEPLNINILTQRTTVLLSFGVEWLPGAPSSSPHLSTEGVTEPISARGIWGPLRIFKQHSCPPWYQILFHVCACEDLIVCALEQVLQRKGFLSYALEYKRNGIFNEKFHSKGWYIMTEKWLPGFPF